MPVLFLKMKTKKKEMIFSFLFDDFRKTLQKKKDFTRNIFFFSSVGLFFFSPSHLITLEEDTG